MNAPSTKADRLRAWIAKLEADADKATTSAQELEIRQRLNTAYADLQKTVRRSRDQKVRRDQLRYLRSTPGIGGEMAHYINPRLNGLIGDDGLVTTVRREGRDSVVVADTRRGRVIGAGTNIHRVQKGVADRVERYLGDRPEAGV